MVNYTCGTCNKIFTKKSTYVYHINRKNKCIPDKTLKDLSKTLKGSQCIPNEPTIKHNQCPNCKKVFSKNSNLFRHMNNKICYIKKDLSMIDTVNTMDNILKCIKR